MNNKTFIAITAAIFTTLAASGVNATLITFEGLAGNNFPDAESYDAGHFTRFTDNNGADIDGLHISSYGSIPETSDASNYWHIQATEPFRSDSFSWAWNGTTQAWFIPGLQITQTEGKTFSLNSFDLAASTASPLITEATVTGFFADGSSISQVISIDTTPNELKQTGNDFAHYTFTGFDNIIRSTIVYEGATERLSIDNINLTEVSPVPEPQTYAMLLAGLGLVGFMGKRKKS